MLVLINVSLLALSTARHEWLSEYMSPAPLMRHSLGTLGKKVNVGPVRLKLLRTTNLWSAMNSMMSLRIFMSAVSVDW